MPTATLPYGRPRADPHIPIWRVALRLAFVELRLLRREPMAAVALIGFPAVMVLVIAGVFGTAPDPDFGNVAPDDYYVASYAGVVLASLGLVTLPVHLATHRQTGVTRRYTAAGLTPGVVAISHAIVGAIVGILGAAVVLGVGAAVYGVTAPDRPLHALGWFMVGLACFVAIGVTLGTLLRTSRAATAMGDLLFVPMFLLGGGGPPRTVMPAPMRAVADTLPLSHVIGGIRHAWLGTTTDLHALWWPVLVTATCIALTARLGRRAGTSGS